MKDTNKNTLSSQTLQVAMSYYKSGQLLVAEEMCRQVLLDDPKNVQSLQVLGTIAALSGRYDDSVELFNQAIRVKKNDPFLFYDLGLALEKWGKLDEALLKYKKAVTLKPDFIEAHISTGNVLKEQGRLDEAELKYKRVIALKPDDAIIHNVLGQVLKDQGKIDEAVAVYKKAIALKPDLPEAYNNLGVIFNDQKNFDAAAEMYGRAISVKPDYAVAHYNLGNSFKEQGKLEEAIAQYAKSITFKPDLVEPYINLGKALKKRGMINEAIVLYEQVLILQPDNPERLTEFFDFICHASAWEKMNGHEARLLDMVRQKREGVFPFMIIGTAATAEDQLTCARSFMRSKERPQQALFTHSPQKSASQKTDGRIKVGYLSCDFYNHATAHLMAELFERHDRSRFSITAYSYGPDDNSPERKRLVKGFDNFVDLRDLSDHAAAQKIYDDGIDILIDLKGGFTEGARIGIAAYRPAPVQVNYLGYPGTMGASFIDYIIADRFIIPEDQEKFYSEKVVCLPDCYQPNDTHRKIADTLPTREACGLPERGFVFCCFNANYKITPQVFDVWMRLLQRTPDSVLWLFEANQSVKGNLRQEAEHRGVNPERIIFAPKLSTPEHLARHRLADVFLDTLPINAHTTASDALWAGLPVLTFAGSTFAGRVAGSLLKAAGLPELITYSLKDYEALALQLAQDPARLSAIRQKLEKTRLQVPLFDIEKFTRNIEKSYQAMWDIWQAGDGPKSFTVS